MRSWLCLALFVGACTRPSDPTPTPHAVDPNAAPTPPVTPAAPDAPPTPDAPPADPATPGPVAAFVLTLADATMIVPVDPTVAPVTAPGLWVLDDAVTPPAIRFFPALPEFPRCACDTAGTACSEQFVQPGTGPLCTCEVRDAEPAVDDDDADEEDPDAEEDIFCLEEDGTPVSLVGGVLYSHVDIHDGCNGMNIYDVGDAEAPMVAQPADLIHRELPLRGCEMNGGVASVDPPWPLGADDCDPEPDPIDGARRDCPECADLETEATVFTLHRGRLFRVEDVMDTSGGSRRVWYAAPVTPANCPSSNDPCGPQDRFPGIDRADDFWIATDASHALEHTANNLTILGGPTPVPRGVLAGSPVLGVRWHRDVRPLLTTMTTRAPVPRLVGPCARDSECEQAGCVLRCAQGTCVDVPALGAVALAPEDVDLKDIRGGREWGDRCVKHMRADRWGAAQAACDAGLAIAVKPAIRGALLYNLGVIARTTGDAAAARRRFAESLAARPGNAAVTQALAELGPE